MRLRPWFRELAECDVLDQRAGKEDDAGTAEYDQRHGDGVERRRIDRPDFVEPDGVDGDDDHVDGVAKAPACGHIGNGG